MNLYCPISRRACKGKLCKLFFSYDCVFNTLVDELRKQNNLKEQELRNGGGSYEQQAQGQRRGA